MSKNIYSEIAEKIKNKDWLLDNVQLSIRTKESVAAQMKQTKTEFPPCEEWFDLLLVYEIIVLEENSVLGLQYEKDIEPLGISFDELFTHAMQNIRKTLGAMILPYDKFLLINNDESMVFPYSEASMIDGIDELVATTQFFAQAPTLIFDDEVMSMIADAFETDSFAFCFLGNNGVYCKNINPSSLTGQIEMADVAEEFIESVRGKEEYLPPHVYRWSRDVIEKIRD